MTYVLCVVYEYDVWMVYEYACVYNMRMYLQVYVFVNLYMFNIDLFFIDCFNSSIRGLMRSLDGSSHLLDHGMLTFAVHVPTALTVLPPLVHTIPPTAPLTTGHQVIVVSLTLHVVLVSRIMNRLPSQPYPHHALSLHPHLLRPPPLLLLLLLLLLLPLTI